MKQSWTGKGWIGGRWLMPGHLRSDLRSSLTSTKTQSSHWNKHASCTKWKIHIPGRLVISHPVSSCCWIAANNAELEAVRACLQELPGDWFRFMQARWLKGKKEQWIWNIGIVPSIKITKVNITELKCLTIPLHGLERAPKHVHCRESVCKFQDPFPSAALFASVLGGAASPGLYSRWRPWWKRRSFVHSEEWKSG